MYPNLPSFRWALCMVYIFPVITLASILTYSSNRILANHAIIIKLSIVCDKEFGDVFQHDERKILEYLTVFMADLNLRFMSLQSSSISFRVTSVTTVSSFDNQPFIENVRGENRTIKLTSVIDEFAKWVYQKRSTLARFDVTMGLTGAALEENTVGVAYGKGACIVDYMSDGGKDMSVVLVSDRGTWNVGAAAHELGHLLGAPHDADDTNCNERNFIMSGMSAERQYFFSACSDKHIRNFLRSSQAACLKQKDAPGVSVFPVTDVTAPSMEVQCQMLLGNKEVFVHHEGSNCQLVKCAQRYMKGYISVRNHYPVDGSPCQYDSIEKGNCLRGTCLPKGIVLEHTASKMCLQQSNIFSAGDIPMMVPCKENNFTPLKKFYILNSDEESSTKLISTSYTIFTTTGMESGMKCLQIRVDKDGDNNHVVMDFDRCSQDSSEFALLRSNLIDDEQGNLLLLHGLTGHYLGYDNKSSKLVVVNDLETNDARIKWNFHTVFGDYVGGDYLDKIFVISKDINSDTEKLEAASSSKNICTWVVLISILLLAMIALLIYAMLKENRRTKLNKTKVIK